MNPAAITQAEARLEKAQRAFEVLQTTSDFAELESAWSDFLLACSGIYSKLEQGSKASPKSTGWFGRKKRERKNDQLLSYVHHARNSDEHGLETVTDRKPGGVGINPSDGGALNITINPYGIPRREGEIVILNHDPQNAPRVAVIPNSIRLKKVTDERFGDSFQPPDAHLGSPITDNSPSNVAKLALAYLTSLIADAKSL